MSARMVTAPLERQLAEGEAGDARLLGPGTTPIALLSANPAADAAASLDDSEKLRDDLLKRLEAAYSISWRHGGLNE